MDATELAKNFSDLPSKEVLDKILALVKENPAAAIAIVGIIGIAYLGKLGIEAQQK